MTAYKTKCMVNGAIATAERKKSEAWVELGKDRRSSDPIRPDPTQASSVLHSIAAIISTSHSVLLNERLEKTSDSNSN